VAIRGPNSLRLKHFRRLFCMFEAFFAVWSGEI